ncbi:Hypothetical predicted protein [Podarcis lilfordi]|uniref:Uncharacterized protein n=1 Tax=Podarcis lilfordi TaxID=74358 RepID=A0AA35LDL6_9SAUR|nr:Hypothetical predicted protein [Podarcis lilfordi]
MAFLSMRGSYLRNTLLCFTHLGGGMCTLSTADGPQTKLMWPSALFYAGDEEGGSGWQQERESLSMEAESGGHTMDAAPHSLADGAPSREREKLPTPVPEEIAGAAGIVRKGVNPSPDPHLLQSQLKIHTLPSKRSFSLGERLTSVSQCGVVVQSGGLVIW